MGLGEFKDRVFNLSIYFDYMATDVEIGQWKDAFRCASELLLDATDGQMQLGTIQYANGQIGKKDEFDIWINNSCENAYTFKNIGDLGGHVSLFRDHKYKPFTIVHELGHYCLYLGDEYMTRFWSEVRDPEGDSHCTRNPIGESACIMEVHWQYGLQLDGRGLVASQGSVSEFCTRLTHTDGHGTSPNMQHEGSCGESCWETIVRKYERHGIVMPCRRPVAEAPRLPEGIFVWKPVDKITQVCFVADVEIPTTPGIKYESLIWGLFLFSQLQLNIDNRQFALLVPQLRSPVEFDPATKSDSLSLKAFRSLFDDRTSKEPATEDAGLTPTTMTSAIALLRPDKPSAGKSLVWLSDKSSLDSADQIADVLRSLGISFHGIHLGSSETEADSMQRLADRTYGTIRFIEEIDTPAYAISMMASLMKAAIDCSDHFGLVADFSETLPTDEPEGTSNPRYADFQEKGFDAFDQNNLVKISNQKIDPSLRYTSCDFPVFIEVGSQRAFFVALFDSSNPIQLYLKPPGQSVMDPKRLGGQFVGADRLPFQLYVIDQPPPGQWFMRVRRNAARSVAPFRLLAASENKTVFVSANIAAVESSAQLKMSVRVHGPKLVVGLDPLFGTFYSRNRDDAQIEKHFRLNLQQPYEFDGSYSGAVRLDQSGLYSFQTQITNAGTATELRYQSLEASSQACCCPVPPFVRIVNIERYVKIIKPG